MLINPLTGRKIKKNGPTHKKLKAQQGGADAQGAEFYDKLLTIKTKPVPSKLSRTTQNGEVVVPINKYNLIPSNLPPAPPGSHSYYHHHAPFSQDFGDYVCLKKDTLKDISMFIRDSMMSSIK